MKIFIDFDDVLFNTKKFKAEYLKIFKKNGVSKKVFQDCYHDNREEYKRYDPIEHIRRICTLKKTKMPKLQQDIVDFVQDTGEYIFGDVSNFLIKFKKADLYLVSFSITYLQKQKIANSGIAKKFKQIEIVNELKARAVGNLIKKNKLSIRDDLYFLDDRVEQLEDVKKRYPSIKTILVRRKEGRYRDNKNKYCDFVCNNLKQVEKIILK